MAKSKSKSPPMDPAVRAAFEAYPPAIRKRLQAVRRLIFDTAAAADVGPLTETLKWGEPAYLTEATGAGSTLRLGWKPAAPNDYALYVNCRTDLVDRFRSQFGADEDAPLRFQGDRAVLLDVGDPLPRDALVACVAATLTYHRAKRGASG